MTNRNFSPCFISRRWLRDNANDGCAIHSTQGWIQGAGACAPQSPKYFFTNIILHRGVLFYKSTDIAFAEMFLSRDSPYRPILFRHLMRRPACQNTADCTALVAPQNRLPLWTILLALEPATAFCILRQKMAPASAPPKPKSWIRP